MGSLGQRAAKLLTVNVGGLKKVCHPAPAPLEPVGLDLIPGELESFSRVGRNPVFFFSFGLKK